MKRSVFSQFFLFTLMLIVGVLIAAQIRTQTRTRSVGLAPNDQAVLLSELVISNRKLRAEVDSLQAQLEAYQNSSRGTLLEELVAELNRIKIANGAIEVSGPGIELILDGPLTALDMQDVINELRNSGAEAIAVNDLRLVFHSTVVVDSTKQLWIDERAVVRPYRFQAIGAPNTMETALLRSGGVIGLLQRAYPNLTVQLTQQAQLVLPVHRAPLAFVYGQAAE